MVMDMRYLRDEETASDAPETADAVEAERELGLVDWDRGVRRSERSGRESPLYYAATTLCA